MPVIASIRILEDSPLLNARKGAVFTHAGKNELASSIMDGSNFMAGSIEKFLASGNKLEPGECPEKRVDTL